MKSWKLKTWKISDLVSHEKNPRFLSKEDARHLKDSLVRFGLIDKPIVTPDGLIIGGHQRIAILKSLKETEVECFVYDGDEPLTSQEIDELNIRLNRNTGSWDWDKLANEWNIDDLFDWGFQEKDFEEPEKRQAKPKVILEFINNEALEEAMKLVEDLSMYSGDKVKVKVKR